MTRMYYRLWYRLDRNDAYLIWFTNDQDGLLVELDRIAPSFYLDADLLAYATAHQLTIDSMQPLLHDLDVIVTWLRRPLLIDIDCDAMLSAWNLFGDLATSVGGNFDPDRTRTQKVYDKLFWGNNLPAVTPPGKHYTPIWNDEERFLIQEILSAGLTLFRQHVMAYDAEF